MPGQQTSKGYSPKEIQKCSRKNRDPSTGRLRIIHAWYNCCQTAWYATGACGEGHDQGCIGPCWENLRTWLGHHHTVEGLHGTGIYKGVPQLHHRKDALTCDLCEGRR